MLSAQQAFAIALQNIVSFVRDIPTHIAWKTVGATVLYALTYLVGADNLSMFLALVVLVVLEYVCRLLSFVSRAKNNKFAAFIEALEVYSFSSAVQLALYGLIASAAHLTDSIVLGGRFLVDMVVSFLAISQLIRILKCASGLGYSIPASFLTWLEDFRDGTLEKEHVPFKK